jgi:N utilization substance protein B
MSNKAIFAKRRDGRVAALQYLYAWSLNDPKNLAEDLIVFFENLSLRRVLYIYSPLGEVFSFMKKRFDLSNHS